MVSEMEFNNKEWLVKANFDARLTVIIIKKGIKIKTYTITL